MIKLIIGLGNPGADYANTRHNVGAWFVEQLAEQHRVTFRKETKFKSFIASAQLSSQACLLAKPTTYMNESGQALAAITRFYKINPQEILVAHDELDFSPGIVRIKEGGGHGGHNGLRDIIRHLGTRDFQRLRIGIGHPGDKNRVSDYVLNAPSIDNKKHILDSIDDGLRAIDDIVQGDLQKAMCYLHQE